MSVQLSNSDFFSHITFLLLTFFSFYFLSILYIHGAYNPYFLLLEVSCLLHLIAPLVALYAWILWSLWVHHVFHGNLTHSMHCENTACFQPFRAGSLGLIGCRHSPVNLLVLGCPHHMSGMKLVLHIQYKTESPTAVSCPPSNENPRFCNFLGVSLVFHLQATQ